MPSKPKPTTRIPLLQSRAPTLTDGNFVLAVRQKLNEATFLMRIFGILEEKAMGIVHFAETRAVLLTFHKNSLNYINLSMPEEDKIVCNSTGNG